MLIMTNPNRASTRPGRGFKGKVLWGLDTKVN